MGIQRLLRVAAMAAASSIPGLPIAASAQGNAAPDKPISVEAQTIGANIIEECSTIWTIKDRERLVNRSKALNLQLAETLKEYVGGYHSLQRQYEAANLEVERLNNQMAESSFAKATMDGELAREVEAYIASLESRIRSGKTNWPKDRPFNHHANETLVKLELARLELAEARARKRDQWPIMARVGRPADVSSGLGGGVEPFAGRDERVDLALQAIRMATPAPKR